MKPTIKTLTKKLNQAIARFNQLVRYGCRVAAAKVAILICKLEGMIEKMATIATITRTEAAKLIKESVEAIDLPGWLPQASVWEKHGKVRVYCKDNGKNEGFVEISSNGKISYEKRSNSRQYKYIDAIREIVDNFSLTIEPETKQQSFRDTINNLPSNPSDKFEWTAKEWCFGATDEESF